MTKSRTEAIDRVTDAASHAADTAVKKARSVGAATADTVGKKMKDANKVADKTIKSGKKLADKSSKKAGKTADKISKAAKKAVRSTRKKQSKKRGLLIAVVALVVVVGTGIALSAPKQNS